MTWEIAFTVVGCLWALVVAYGIKTDRTERTRAQIENLLAELRQVQKDVEWLKKQ